MVSLLFTSLNIYVMYSSIKICYSITSRCNLGEFNYLKWWSCCRWLSLLALCPLSLQLLQVGSNYWMAWASPSREGDTGNSSTTKLILVYTALSFGSSLFVIVRTLFVYMCGLFISQKYFLDMIRCIFRAPMTFFDSTPIGRILNRVCEILKLLQLSVYLLYWSSICLWSSFAQLCTMNC